MDTSLWKTKKAALHYYKRRAPEETALYRIISGCHEELKWSWEELFQSKYGALRSEVPKAFSAYLNCGILAHGCARAECQNKKCNHSELIAFSCKTRSLCPSCAAKSAVLFAENLVEKVLLPFDHRHCVFTVPKRVRPFFKFNRVLMAHLYRAAWDAWKELALLQYPTGSPAAVQALHSSGDLLAFHPHVHGLFLDGLVMPDGSFQPVTIDQEQLQDLFAKKVLLSLLDEDLLTKEDIDNILSWQHSGFNVFIGDTIKHSDQKRLLFAAQYLKKCPLSNERLGIIEPNKTSGETTIEYASYKNGQKSVRLFTPLEFTAEVSQHIPNTWEQTSRFFGAYSARTRGAAREKQNMMLPIASENSLSSFEPIQKPSSNWARLMKKVFEFDPLICPKCQGTMKIKAFITDPKETARISKNLTLQQRAPPKLQFSVPIAA